MEQQSLKYKKRERKQNHLAQRRDGTSTVPRSISDDRKTEKKLQLVREDGNDGKQRRSTFDHNFKGWRGPVSNSSSPEQASRSVSSCTPVSMTCERAQLQRTPSQAMEVIDNSYYRSIVRRSISEARQIPRIPIIPRQVSVPSIDWDSLVIADSRESHFQRRSAFEWERPDCPRVQRQPRNRNFTFANPNDADATSSVDTSNTESSDDEQGNSAIFRQVMQMRDTNIRLKQQIAELKERQ